MIEPRALSCKRDHDRIHALLAACGIRLPDNLEAFTGLFEGEELLACAGRRENVILCAAVRPDMRGEGLLGTLVSALRTEIRGLGYDGAFVFTKCEAAEQFCSLGFSVLAEAEGAVLLYSRRDGVERWAAGLPGLCHKPSSPAMPQGAGRVPPLCAQSERTGCIVINANPFTNGHRSLIERAAALCARLYVLVLEREAARFPFADRIRLVAAGTADLPNVSVLPGGPFVISAATFPTYFLKEDSDGARVHAALDATLFAERVAPALGVGVRFVGTEPLDAMTRRYHEALTAILPPRGVEIVTFPRATHAGTPISASRVRALFDAGDLAGIAALVPEPTYAYLLRRYNYGGQV